MHSDTITAAVDDFVERLTRRLSDRVKSITLYGSWARGTARPDSDIDLLVVVDRRDAAVTEEIQDVALEVDLERLTYISVKTCPEAKLEEMRRLGDPFLRSVESEGRVLWTPKSRGAPATA